MSTSARPAAMSDGRFLFFENPGQLFPGPFGGSEKICTKSKMVLRCWTRKTGKAASQYLVRFLAGNIVRAGCWCACCGVGL